MSTTALVPILSQETVRPLKWELPLAPFKQMEDEANGFHVGLLSRQADWECVMLGAFGLTYKAIAERTGLTEGQVGYRLHKARVSPKSYRNGHGRMAKLDTVSAKAKLLVKGHVETVLEIEANADTDR